VKPRRPYGPVAVLCVAVFALVSSMWAQDVAAPRNTGVPQDWSQGHIVFSRDTLALHPDLIYREPRVLHQALQRWQPANSDVFRAVDPVQASADASGDKRDWNVNLMKGRISLNMFPAKFSFDPAAPPDCTKDYVIFGLAVVGVTSGQANLVAYNNLYSGTGGLCGAAPTVLFAYNTSTTATGKIVTSPVLSVDGKKIAFVESVTGSPASAIFHVLTWTAGQGTTAAAAAPSMTSTIFATAANSTTSSPWIDYSTDTAYLGADSGLVYKITGVFKGTPTLAGHPWPVTVSTNFHLTPPVLDSARGVLMVGSANGSLYQINTTTGALSTLVVGKSGSTSPGIVAAPIVDITNGTTFVVSANDGTSAVLAQADTATMTLLAKARIGQGSSGGTVLNIFQPAFTNSYFTSPSTGNVRLCGTGAADTTPWQYAFGFTGRTMKTTAAFSKQLLASTDARCTGWTEFFNPNVSGGTDFFFFGLTQDCTAPGTGPTDGCVVSRTSDTTFTKATLNGGPSGIVVDNYSTSGQASSIYLSGAKVNTGYKFTQNGLQ
jgi:hypothetical protein